MFAELNTQWPISESAQTETTTIRQNTRITATKQGKSHQLMLFKFKHDRKDTHADTQTRRLMRGVYKVGR